MTTPAKNINMASPGPYKQTQDGIVTASGIAVSSRFSSFRPKSRLNALRTDLTRAPSAWQSSGGYGSGSNGVVFFRKPRPDPPFWRYSESVGTIASPPTQMGAFESPVPLDVMRAFAVRDALGHFAEAEQRLGVSLRETRQTVQMVTNYYRGVSDGAGKLLTDLHNARNGERRLQRTAAEFRRWARGWKQVPGRYLEYLYGIRPLADEVNNAVEVLTQTRDRGCSFRMTLKGRYRDGRQLLEITPVTNGNEDTFNARVEAEIRYGAKASLVFQLPTWYWSTLPPVTPFSEQLDTTSLSFVLDWVLPVKNWVRGFEGLQLRPFFKEGSATTFVRRSATRCRFKGKSGWQGEFTLPYSIRDYHMTRVVYSSFPTEVVMTLPRLRNLLGIDKMDQVAALAGQRLSALGRSIHRFY